MKIRFIAPAALCMLAGCSASTGVVQMGNDTFYTSKQSGNAFAGAGTLKADVMTEASGYCAKRGKSLQIISATEARPPYIFGNYPRAELQFSCVQTESKG